MNLDPALLRIEAKVCPIFYFCTTSALQGYVCLYVGEDYRGGY